VDFTESRSSLDILRSKDQVSFSEILRQRQMIASSADLLERRGARALQLFRTKRKDEFLRGTGHELRNPLAGLCRGGLSRALRKARRAAGRKRISGFDCGQEQMRNLFRLVRMICSDALADHPRGKIELPGILLH